MCSVESPEREFGHMKKLEYRGWIIDIPPASKRFVAYIWRPNSTKTEPFDAVGKSLDAIIDLAQAYIDYEIERASE
jgi:hypothetical protein